MPYRGSLPPVVQEPKQRAICAHCIHVRKENFERSRHWKCHATAIPYVSEPHALTGRVTRYERGVKLCSERNPEADCEHFYEKARFARWWSDYWSILAFWVIVAGIPALCVLLAL